MKQYKKMISMLLISSMVLTLCACADSTDTSKNVDSATESKTENSTGTTSVSADFSNYKQNNESLTFDNSKWNYDADNDVYWQINVGYCSDPETTDYETLGIYVPGSYMTGTKNSDGTYTCTINSEGKVGNYTASTAPIVFPVNTAGYAAQPAPTEYSYDGLSDYLNAGFVYVYAGMRGKENGYDSNNDLTYSGGAPWGVTDLKSAIRYYRYNAAQLPGSTNSIFTFGMSGGGAQSALAGATGDSELYYQYLESIGSAMTDQSGNYISDAVAGSMCWCPITSLDYADEAYEWNMGQFATTDTRADGTWTASLSKDLATSFASYINELGLKDESGDALTLEQSDSGIYQAGSYYDYLLAEVEKSLNNFLSDTTFPYTPSNAFHADGGFGGSGATGGGGMGASDGKMPDTEAMKEMTGTEMPQEGMKSGNMSEGGTEASGSTVESGSGTASGTQDSTTYATVQDYIDSLNSDTQWISYDSSTNTATITSLEAFVEHCKNATKAVGAFDDLSRTQAENDLFGNDSSDALHFDSILSNLLQTNKDTYSTLSGWDAAYVDDYANDIASTDKFETTIQQRLNMYNPMYYLSNYYDGYGTSTVATFWRIRTGIDQGDTALTVETNLALALQQNATVKDVDFETVWGLGHTMAERTGDSTTNFVDWVNECAAQLK